MPGLRRLTEIDAFMRISFSLRASLVRRPWRFAWNELRPGRRVATYRLKESGIAITIRHKSNDVLVLDEVFSQREYSVPEQVRARLARAGQAPKVADLGANIGLFGAWILGRFPAAEIVALEPDPTNAALHRITIEKNGRAATWKLLEAAAMTRPGPVRFSPGSFALSHVAVADEAAGVEVEGLDVFPLIEDVDLLKIDIEGAEWPLLQDPRFRELGATVVVLEYHPEGAPGSEPAHAAEALLGDAGFTVAAHHRKDTGTGVLWALNSSS
jgi:FkbM family methyltransferase